MGSVRRQSVDGVCPSTGGGVVGLHAFLPSSIPPSLWPLPLLIRASRAWFQAQPVPGIQPTGRAAGRGAGLGRGPGLGRGVTLTQVQCCPALRSFPMLSCVVG